MVRKRQNIQWVTVLRAQIPKVSGEWSNWLQMIKGNSNSNKTSFKNMFKNWKLPAPMQSFFSGLYFCPAALLGSILKPPSFSRLHLLRSIQKPLAALLVSPVSLYEPTRNTAGSYCRPFGCNPVSPALFSFCLDLWFSHNCSAAGNSAFMNMKELHHL